MNARFHAPDAKTPGEVVPLPDDEAEHLTRVLRLKPGDAVRVFNGRGGEFDAVVEQAGKNGVLVRVGNAQRPAPEARVAITLAQAVLKGDKMDDVVRDAVMLGVAAIQPIVTEHAEVTARVSGARPAAGPLAADRNLVGETVRARDGAPNPRAARLRRARRGAGEVGAPAAGIDVR